MVCEDNEHRDGAQAVERRIVAHNSVIPSCLEAGGAASVRLFARSSRFMQKQSLYA